MFYKSIQLGHRSFPIDYVGCAGANPGFLTRGGGVSTGCGGGERGKRPWEEGVLTMVVNFPIRF